MSRLSSLTVSDKLLLAAFDLDAGQGHAFTAEDLVVAAWRRFPRTFGLRGHDDSRGLPSFPDSNRVFAEIMGSKPIRKRGLLTKVGEKTYALTASGREVASTLARTEKTGDLESSSSEKKSTLSREIRAKLERLLNSRVMQRAKQDEMDRVTFHDACLFWSITPRSTSIELEGKLADTRRIIKLANRALEDGATVLRSGSSELTRSILEQLKRVNQELQERFAEELDTIRGRRTQRKAQV